MNDAAEKDIFLSALDLPPEDRGAFLDRACAGDGGLRRRVEALLRASEEASDFLAAPTIDTPPPAPAPHDAELHPGAAIGPYTLQSELGEGGFGRVFLARQRTPVTRTVALKVLKAGMDSRAIVARFEAERQALAVMDHPSVARVFDGGQTAGGRPYFVMEYVRGEPITTYCARKKLSVRQRLDLFEQVCLAVQHAHQKGIIHRDLKPSNVLITTVDDRPVPKVIDFGIAKAIGREAAGGTMMTVEGHLIGTPAYMSPEQAAGAGVMDTRSDVYTLGVLLYELLTGTLPFDEARLEKTPLPSLVRIICEESPPKPSTRVLKTAEAGTQAESRQLSSRLRGDLDWIVMRALEKDPARRYQTAFALAGDIRRHLRDEPVEAGPPSGLYRLSKFAQRHRGEILAAGLILAALVAGLVSSLLFAARLDRQATLLALQLERSNAFADFTRDMLSGLDPAVARGEDTALLRRMLADAESRLQAQAPASAEAAAEMHELLGTAFNKIADFEAAERHYTLALESAEAATPRDEALALRIRHALGQTLVESSRFAEARRELTEVYNARAASLGPEHEDTVEALANLGMLDRLEGDFQSARTRFEQVVALREAALGDDHADTMSARNSLATVLNELGENEASAAMLARVVEGQTATLGPDHPHTLATRTNYAGALINLGRREDAAAILEEVLEIKRRVLEPDHPSLIVALNNLASLRRDLGDAARAEELWTEAADCAARALGPRHMHTLILTSNLAGHMVKTGRAAPALERLEAALPVSEEVLGARHRLTLAIRSHIAGAQLALDRPDDAAATAERLCADADQALGADHPELATHRRLLGQALLACGRAAEARDALAQAFALLEAQAAPDAAARRKTAELLASACAALEDQPGAQHWTDIAKQH